ncbi:DUF5701 family protein [Patescibacteria group bacterium]
MIEKLVPLFRNTDTDIDEAVKTAKDRLATEATEAKREDLEKMFDAQIQTWRDHGCPEAIVEILAEQKDSVLSKASKMTFGNGNIPILSVVPRTYLTIYSQMLMVKNGDKTGYTNMDPTEITDVVDVPTKPYWIYDVENGKAMLGKSPETAEKLIKKDGRSCLTETEVIAIGIQDLPDHYMDASGSRSGSSDHVPYLYLRDGRPRLHWDYADVSDSRWGSASCGSR